MSNVVYIVFEDAEDRSFQFMGVFPSRQRAMFLARHRASVQKSRTYARYVVERHAVDVWGVDGEVVGEVAAKYGELIDPSPRRRRAA